MKNSQVAVPAFRFTTAKKNRVTVFKVKNVVKAHSCPAFAAHSRSHTAFFTVNNSPVQHPVPSSSFSAVFAAAQAANF